MANRKRKGRPVSGWIALDKPVGMTSTQAVSAVKHLFKAQKAGHAGTLDPLASGCLPIALGEATKAMPQVVDGDKAYRFTIAWGAETDTDDAEGKVVANSDDRPERAAIEAAMADFVGEIEQTPPAFSAVKVGGERAYDLAREGETVELASRLVRIDSFDLIDVPDADHVVFEIACGKGTYVRSLARDLGRELGCHGHVSELRRLSVGPFGEEMLVPLADLRDAADEGGAEACDAYLLPVEAALSDLIGVPLHERDANRVLRGQAVLLRGATAPMAGPAYATGGGQLLAIGEIEAGSFQPRRVFHL
jgi:tRNA pseudouridine55 synthase